MAMILAAAALLSHTDDEACQRRGPRDPRGHARGGRGRYPHCRPRRPPRYDGLHGRGDPPHADEARRLVVALGAQAATAAAPTRISPASSATRNACGDVRVELRAGAAADLVQPPRRPTASGGTAASTSSRRTRPRPRAHGPRAGSPGRRVASDSRHRPSARDGRGRTAAPARATARPRAARCPPPDAPGSPRAPRRRAAPACRAPPAGRSPFRRRGGRRRAGDASMLSSSQPSRLATASAFVADPCGVRAERGVADLHRGCKGGESNHGLSGSLPATENPSRIFSR